MEIICYSCQGTLEASYKDIYRLEEDYFVTFCPACGAENEMWDVEDWLEPDQFEWILKNNNEEKQSYEDLDDDELLELLEEGGWDDE